MTKSLNIIKRKNIIRRCMSTNHWWMLFLWHTKKREFLKIREHWHQLILEWNKRWFTKVKNSSQLKDQKMVHILQMYLLQILQIQCLLVNSKLEVLKERMPSMSFLTLVQLWHVLHQNNVRILVVKNQRDTTDKKVILSMRLANRLRLCLEVVHWKD